MQVQTIGENLVGAAAVAGTVVLSPVVRRWYNRWGATPNETKAVLPGDTRVPYPRIQYTRAVTIQASPEIVWGYLAQLGQERGGLYSYQALENLIGCQMRNADHIVPEWQRLRVGDRIRLGPKGYPLYRIVSLIPGYSITCAGADPKTEEATGVTIPMPVHYTNFEWTLVVKPIDQRLTRLISRARTDHSPDIGTTVMWHCFEPVNFVMERKMLLTIKRLAERDDCRAAAYRCN